MLTGDQKRALSTVLHYHLQWTGKSMSELAAELGLEKRSVGNKVEQDYGLKKFLERKHEYRATKLEPWDTEIFEKFKAEKLLLDEQRKIYPEFIQMAIRVAYNEEAEPQDINAQPSNIICRIQDYTPKYIRRVCDVFSGTWDVIRYAHHGKRVVRGLLHVERPVAPFVLPKFSVYFRTQELTTKEGEPIQTVGSVFPLSHGNHALFLGEDDGYPMTIVAPLPRKSGPFYGLVQRRHHGDAGLMFTIKAHFSKAPPETDPEDPAVLEKIGSWSKRNKKVMAVLRRDIKHLDDTLTSLRKPLNGGGFVLDSD